MLRQCDGDGCQNDLPWKFEQESLIADAPQPFSASLFSDSFRRVVHMAGPLCPPLKVAPLVNLCKSCWLRQGRIWDAEVGIASGQDSLKNTPAKTDQSGGVHFNNQLEYYREGKNPVGKLDINMIVSTRVHEMSHYWSGDGLKRFEEGRVKWDECVTDYLARKTYFGVVRGKPYKTNYGNMSDFIKRWLDKVTRPIKNWEYERYKIAEFRAAPFDSLKNLDQRALSARERFAIERELTKRFVTWYLWPEPRHGSFGGDGQSIEKFFSSLEGVFLLGRRVTNVDLGYDSVGEFWAA